MTLTQVTKAGLHTIALDHVFTIGASGSNHYTFQGEGLNGTVNDPTLYLTRGKTYRFENGSGGHPIRIQSTSGASGTAYNTGVTNNAGSGTVIVEVQHDAPDVLYYQCTSHANMNGVLYITGALADGGVTTAKLADDAVTDAKLANSINSAIAANTAKSTNATHTGDVTGSGSLTIASNAVTTAKIADDAVTEAKIANSAVSTNQLADTGVSAAKLANNAVTTAKIADDAVTDAKLANSINTAIAANTAKNTNATHTGDVTGSGSLTIASNAVTTAKIADDAVTAGKLANDIAINTTGNISAAAGTFTGNLTIPDSIIHSGDTDTKISFPSNDAIDLQTANASRLRVTSSNVGVHMASPVTRFQVGSHTFSGGHGMYENGRVGMSNHGSLTGLMLASTYNDAGVPEYGIVFVQGPDTSNYNVWSISPDGPAKGNSLSLHYGAQNTNIHLLANRKFEFDGDGDFRLTAGNVDVASGYGIDFSATSDTSTTGASAGSEILDDYEEGTWLPQYHFNGSASGVTQPGTRNGKYTKIGNRVFFNCHISGTTGSHSGHLQIDGLPYTADSNGGTNYSAFASWVYAGFDNEYQVIFRSNPSSTKMEVQRAGASVFASEMNESANYMITGHYKTA